MKESSNPKMAENQVTQQLLAEYQVVQSIADHEVQSIYLTFAVLFPLLATASISLLAILISDRLQHDSTQSGLLQEGIYRMIGGSQIPGHSFKFGGEL